MIYLVFGLGLLAAFLMLGNLLARIPAAQIAQHARIGGFALLVGLAGLLLLTGRVHAMTQVLALVNHAWRQRNAFRRPPGFDDVSGTGSAGSSGSGPAIRTRYLEMHLDEVTGAIDGQFVEGPYAGQELAGLAQADLVNALGAMRDDAESVRLLEAYLDRTFAGWREDHQEGTGSRRTSPSDTSGMSEDEAYEVLGLEPGADPEAIRTAHRRLMGSIHPDRGGSTYLAAKVNLAKDVLLGLHG
ncbi:MAG: DnaJ domain-containing protein [Cohaesibacteraceae bacterium]